MRDWIGAPKPAGGLFGAAPATNTFGAPAADKPSFSFGQPAAPATGLFGAPQQPVGGT